MNRLFGIIGFCMLLSSLCWAGGSKNKDDHPQSQQPVPVTISSSKVTTPSPPPVSLYWYGDGGKGIKIAVLEPTGRGLSATEQYIPSMIQSSITGDFNRYSAMTIVDRQNLEKILVEQRHSLSGDYSDDDYISIGKLTNTRYILAGSLTKTASAFILELAVTDAESGERKASYPPKAVSPFALENLSAIKEATAELLKQLGVELTNTGFQALNSTVNIAQVKAETALAKGIEAQKQGTVVEALSYFIQANNYNTGLAEAANRMNILAANITSGNIGLDTRNDIAWRREWVKRLQETETFFSTSLKEPQPFYIVYSTDIKQGKVDYQKETTDLTIWIGFYPDFLWAENINEVINAVKRGLQTTGRAQVWELDWPAKSINNPSPFVTQTKNLTSTVVVEIVNNEGKSIGRQTVKSPYGFESRTAVITPSWQWEGDIVFSAVNANLITDKLTIRITSIDGIVAENAAKQKNISVMPLTEWESLLKMLPSTRQNIENARQRQREQDTAVQRERDVAAQRERDAAAQRERDAAALREREAAAQRQREAAAAQRQREAEAQVHYKQVDTNYTKNDFTRAISDYTEAIRINPNFTEAYFWRGVSYFRLQSYNKAIEDFSQAIRINPNYADAYNERGKAYSWVKNYARAKADFATAYRLNPADPNIIKNYNDSRNW